MQIRSILLAAGQGTRMRSRLPKVLHPLMGKPLIWHAVQTARQASNSQPVVVVGYRAQEVRSVLGDEVEYAQQEEQLGTGHAVMQAASLLRGKADLVLVTYGDMPLITVQTLERLVAIHAAHAGPITMATIITQDPRGFGRILRSETGQVQAIIEEAQATPEQLAIRELNPSVYCFDAAWLWDALEKIPLSPKGEYYLTDLVGIAVSQGLRVQPVPVDDPAEMIGINTRVDLADADAILRRRINRDWMLAGVTMIEPDSVYIEPGVQIGQDTVIWPNSYLQGDTSVGDDCQIGPNTIIRNSVIGSRCRILSSLLEGALLEDEVDMGPFARLRTGAHLARGVHMGNFGEVKNSYLAPGVKMGHFSYLGDATVGENVNIGAGTITCNYDGQRKHPTVIEKDAFIGSDTMLVAPVTLGEGARTGAGSVVTHDVPPGMLVYGAPARPKQKKEHAP